MRHHWQISKWNPKGGQESLQNWGGLKHSVARVTVPKSSHCGAHLGESYCKKSNTSGTNWQRYLSSSYFGQNFVEFMALSLG